MKKLLLSLALLCSAQSLFAQSTTNYVCRLDSIEYTNPSNIIDEKEIFEYNDAGLITKEIYKDIINGELIPTYIISKTYNEQNKITSYIVQSYSNSTQSLEYQSKREYIYNTNGYLVEENTFDFVNNVWQNDLKYTYTTDSEGIYLTRQDYYWVEATSTYQITNKYTYNYDDQNREIETLVEFWSLNLGAFVNSSKITTTYIQEPNQLTQIREEFNYNSNDSIWVITKKDTYKTDNDGNQTFVEVLNSPNGVNNSGYQSIYTYHTGNIVASHLRTEWIDGEWVNDRQYTYTLNSSDLLVEYVRQRWVDNAWKNESREVMTYNANDLLASKTYYSININTQDWFIYRKDTSEYDVDGNRTIWYSENYNISPNEPNGSGFKFELTYNEYGYQTREMYYKLQNYSLVLNKQTDSYYSNCRAAEVAELEEIDEHNFTIYPNPASTQTTIVSEEHTEVSIYNAMGTLITSQPIAVGNNVVDLSNFANGMYILRFAKGQSLKLIKE